MLKLFRIISIFVNSPLLAWHALEVTGKQTAFCVFQREAALFVELNGLREEKQRLEESFSSKQQSVGGQVSRTANTPSDRQASSPAVAAPKKVIVYTSVEFYSSIVHLLFRVETRNAEAAISLGVASRRRKARVSASHSPDKVEGLSEMSHHIVLAICNIMLTQCLKTYAKTSCVLWT